MPPSIKQDPPPPVPMEAMQDVFVDMLAKHKGVSAESLHAAINSASTAKPTEPGERPMSIGEFLEKGEPTTVYYLLREAKNEARGESSRDFGCGFRDYETDPGVGRRMVRDRPIIKPVEYGGPGAVLFPNVVFRLDLADCDGMAIRPACVEKYPHAKTNSFAEMAKYYSLLDVVKMLHDDPHSWLNTGLASGEIITAAQFAEKIRTVYRHWLLDMEMWKQGGSVGEKPAMRQLTLTEIGMNSMMLDAPTHIRTGALILKTADNQTGEVDALEA